MANGSGPIIINRKAAMTAHLTERVLVWHCVLGAFVVGLIFGVALS